MHLLGSKDAVVITVVAITDDVQLTMFQIGR
jgi:hypothetical protein